MSASNYCPFCQRNIEPYIDEETQEVLTMPDGGVIYVHDDVPHDEEYNFGVLQ